jgi:Zn finger protein HypA/HybF involved in hydrogenase expression
MTLEMECQYCGKKWEETVYYRPNSNNIRCPTCKDRNIKIKERDETKGDVFGYNKEK